MMCSQRALGARLSTINEESKSSGSIEKQIKLRDQRLSLRVSLDNAPINFSNAKVSSN